MSDVAAGRTGPQSFQSRLLRQWPAVGQPRPGAFGRVVPGRPSRIRTRRTQDHRCHGRWRLYRLREGGLQGTISAMSRHQASPHIPIRLLGQSGCRLGFPGCTVYLDPYLSNSVQELDAADLARLAPIPLAPSEVTDADWVLITHDHIDHCDPHTLPALAAASPRARFLGPTSVLGLLARWGIAAERPER